MSSSQQEDKYALHAAAREGKVTTNPKLSQRKDDDGRLPIHWAASSNQHAILLLLSQQKTFDPDVEDDMGWTPLMIAASVKDGEAIVDVLLQRGADSALHFVASKNNLEVARKLFAHKPPASSRVRDKRGQYPLHRAAAVGSTPMVKLLLEHRSPLNATDVAGYTALHHAVAEGHGDTAIELLKAGAETDKRDTDGYLALDLAPDKQVRKYIERAAENEGIEL
ncbi:ankyrin repeat-containing domain protein [Astrocystis sublimbata]|nr:ankyrin repeat-containing domain protein [Astrocystis sublimbata]KAI0204699.1 ankyrin repeat-containing domain protein [Astrocystis sublimbata]